MIELGKILKFLFPNFVARLVELDHLQNKVVSLKISLIRFGDGGSYMNSSVAKAKAKQLQSVRREFNLKKMWLMKSV